MEQNNKKADPLGVEASRLAAYVYKIKAIDEDGAVSWVEKAKNDFAFCSGKGKIWTSLGLALKTLDRLKRKDQRIYIKDFFLVTYEMREVENIEVSHD